MMVNLDSFNATSASIADFVDRRRKGEPVFGQAENASARDDATSDNSE